MAGMWEQVQSFFWNILYRPTVIDLIDIALMAFIIYRVLMLTRETRAIEVVKGLALIFVISIVSEILGLTMLHWLFGNIITNGVIVLIVVFQPEIRRALEQLGRSTKHEKKVGMEDSTRIANELTNCLLRLARRRVGALIVIEQKTGLKDYIETGTKLDSEISSGLLENIFEPNTPLHDGAVILRGQRVAAAACILNLSDSSTISRDLGTRHRAGLGITESTDAIVLIVSEETGIVSMARGGKLTRHLDGDSIRRTLQEIYQAEEDKTLFSSIKGLFRKGGRKA